MKRLNLVLEPATLERLRRRARRLKITTPEFVRRLIAHGLSEFEARELDRRLIEGYRSMGEEDRRLAREFEAADREGWDR